MKTIIRLETTDEERMLIAASLGLSQPVSRKLISQLVEKYIDGLKQGMTSDVGHQARSDSEPNAQTEIVDEHQSSDGRGQRVSQFVPSRGDEPYLYKPKDPELAAACRSVLDGLEVIEDYNWDALERNRK